MRGEEPIGKQSVCPPPLVAISAAAVPCGKYRKLLDFHVLFRRVQRFRRYFSLFGHAVLTYDCKSHAEYVLLSLRNNIQLGEARPGENIVDDLLIIDRKCLYIL